MNTHLHKEEYLQERLMEQLEDKIIEFFGDIDFDTDEAADEMIKIGNNLILSKFKSIQRGYSIYYRLPDEDIYDFIDKQINSLTPEIIRKTEILKTAYEAQYIISESVKGLKDWDLIISELNKNPTINYYLKNTNIQFEFSDVLAKITIPNFQDKTAVITTKEGAILFCLEYGIKIDDFSNIQKDEMLEDEINMIKDFALYYFNQKEMIDDEIKSEVHPSNILQRIVFNIKSKLFK